LAVINFARREIEAKIVYYGPALSGKTTNVKSTHGQLNRADVGKLHILSTEDDRTLFFDYTPITHGEIAGFTAKFKLFSVPGQAFYKETRQVVLSGADAVVFVADSHPERAKANREALKDLISNLEHHGLDIHSFPVVIQFNKRDLSNARSIADMQKDLSHYDLPIEEATALTGAGVLETLDRVTNLAADRIRERLVGKESSISLKAIDKEEAEDDQAVILKHLVAIQKVRGSEEETAKEMARKGEIDPSEFAAFFNEFVDRDTNDGVEGEKHLSEETDNTEHVLPMGPRVDLAILHGTLQGYEAVRLLESTPLPDGRFRLDILCVHPENGERSRLTVNLRSELEPSKVKKVRNRPQPVQSRQVQTSMAPLIFAILGLAVGACLGLLVGMS
jgi:signal recognition particle receptor subunit beta